MRILIGTDRKIMDFCQEKLSGGTKKVYHTSFMDCRVMRF